MQNQYTLEIRQQQFGFLRDPMFDGVVGPEHIEEITSNKVQAIVFKNEAGMKLVQWVGEMDVTAQWPLDKCVAKLQRLAKKQGVSNVKAPVTFVYGGNIYR